MFGKSGAYKVRAVFENAGQLVSGNQVRVSGQPVGTITDIRLNESAQALMSMGIDEDLAPLHEATKATIRATSLSGIANRYISLQPGPNSEKEIADGGLIGLEHTTGAVDLDGQPVHYLSVMNPLNPEIMTGYPTRLATSRSNPYTEPGAYDRLSRDQPLPVFGSYLCTSNPTPAPPPPNAYLSERLAAEIQKFVFGVGTDNVGRAPPCIEQAPLGRIIGQPGRYPALQPLP
jgi:hypothetical protein